MGEDDLETIARFMTVAEAQAAAAMLDGLEIEAFVPDETTASVIPHAQIALGGIRLQVRREDVERARAALDGSARIEDADAPTEITHGEEPLRPGVRESAAWRAWRAAILGSFFCPGVMNVYSLAVIADVAFGEGPLSSGVRWRLWAAGAIDVFVLATAAMVVVAIQLGQ